MGIIAGRFRVSELPRIFVADRHGVVRWVGDESATEADVLAAIDMHR